MELSTQTLSFTLALLLHVVMFVVPQGTFPNFVACSSLCIHGSCLYPAPGAKSGAECHCYAGWSGDYCSTPCRLPCVHGLCVVTSETQMCVCKFGYSGEDCSQPRYNMLAVLNFARLMRPPAIDSPANAAGSAISKSSNAAGESPASELPRLFPPNSATHREVRVPLVENAQEQVEQNVAQGSSQCMGNFICRNGGRCAKGSFGGFRCQCPPDYTGTFCQIPCPKPCFHGGRCTRLRYFEPNVTSEVVPVSAYRYAYRCICMQSYAGEQCERKV